MRRHRYPHGRSARGIRVHNGIRIRIRKVEAVPVGAEFIRTVYSLSPYGLLVIVGADRGAFDSLRSRDYRFNCVP